MDAVFQRIAERPAEEVLCLETESGIECDVTDFDRCSLEQGDLVLHGQGPEGGRQEPFREGEELPVLAELLKTKGGNSRPRAWKGIRKG